MNEKQKQNLLEEFDLRFTEMLDHNDFAFRLSKQRELIRVLDNLEQYMQKNLTSSPYNKEKLANLAKEFIEDAKEQEFVSEIYETQNSLIVSKLKKLSK